MIFFVANDGTIIKGMLSPVYQGAANSNTIYLIAPFATNTAVTVAFRLPNGVVTSPAAMTAQNALQGIVNAETGQTYAGWTYDLPNGITELYGTVTAQFFFYSAEAGVITATSATSFEVGRGVPAVLPETPEDDVYEAILSNLAALQTQLNNGSFAARSIYNWNSTYTYGAGEVTFYPDIGTYGAFVKSVQAGNTNHAPYTDGTVNSAWWSEVVNFNTVTDDFFTEIKAVQTAAEAAQSAAETAQGKAEDAQAAAEEAESGAQTQAQAAASSATAAEESADAAESAKAAAQTAQNAAESAEGNAQAYAGQASGSASAASQSEINARAYMEQAKQYAQKEYQVVESFDDLPRPGDSAYIYLVPSGSGSSNDHYSEYLWISEGNDYEFVGAINEVDLSGYAQTNGTYPNMTVGNASNAASAQTAVKATQDAAGNDIAATYAKQTGTYPNMSVGNASNAASAQTAVKAAQDAAGNVIADTYAKQQGSYPQMSVGNASNATLASNSNMLGGVAAASYALKQNSSGGFAAGSSAMTTNGGAVGNGTSSTTGFAGGQNSNTTTGAAIGTNAVASGAGAVQLGTGTNTSSDTLQFRSYPLVDANGNIEPARLLDMYPVGSYYITESSTTPASLFGGRWVRVSGYFLYGAASQSSVGGTGGEAQHTLTVNEMPKHHHDTIGGLRWSQTLYAVDTLGNTEGGMGVKTNTDNSGAGYRSKMETNQVGGNAAHNNMPPYRTVNIWRRTA